MRSNKKIFHKIDWDHMDTDTAYMLTGITIWYWGIQVDIDAQDLKDSGGLLLDKEIVVQTPNEKVVKAILDTGIDMSAEEIIIRAAERPLYFSLPYEAYCNRYLSPLEEEKEKIDEEDEENTRQLIKAIEYDLGI